MNIFRFEYIVRTFTTYLKPGKYTEKSTHVIIYCVFVMLLFYVRGKG